MRACEICGDQAKYRWAIGQGNPLRKLSRKSMQSYDEIGRLLGHKT